MTNDEPDNKIDDIHRIIYGYQSVNMIVKEDDEKKE